MIRILLIDDSQTIQKVVKLTFASQPGYDVKVARTPKEAGEILASYRPEAIIAYARFAGEPNPQAFLELKNACKAIVILAESNENLDAFQQAGFRHFLRKPFLSEDLKNIVLKLVPPVSLYQTGNGSDGQADASDDFSPAFGGEATVSAAPKSAAPKSASPSKPPPPPIQAFRSTTKSDNPPTHNPFQMDGLPLNLNDNNNPFSQKTAAPPPPPQTNMPQITMDVEALERSYRASMSQKSNSQNVENSNSNFGIAAPRSRAPETTAPKSRAPDSAPPRSQQTLSINPQQSEFGLDGELELSLPLHTKTSAVPEPDLQDRELNNLLSFSESPHHRPPPLPRHQPIDIDHVSAEPVPVEDMIVAQASGFHSGGSLSDFPRPPKISPPDVKLAREPLAPPRELPRQTVALGADSRLEIQTAVDEALLRALERAVPAKIDAKLNLEWHKLVQDISEKLKLELSQLAQQWVKAEVAGMKTQVLEQLRAVVQPEFRKELADWLNKESPKVTSEVVRDEIRRLLDAS